MRGDNKLREKKVRPKLVALEGQAERRVTGKKTLSLKSHTRRAIQDSLRCVANKCYGLYSDKLCYTSDAVAVHSFYFVIIKILY